MVAKIESEVGAGILDRDVYDLKTEVRRIKHLLIKILVNESLVSEDPYIICPLLDKSHHEVLHLKSLFWLLPTGQSLTSSI